MCRRLKLFQQYGRDPPVNIQNSLDLDQLEWSSKPGMMIALLWFQVEFQRTSPGHGTPPTFKPRYQTWNFPKRGRGEGSRQKGLSHLPPDKALS